VDAVIPIPFKIISIVFMFIPSYRWRYYRFYLSLLMVGILAACFLGLLIATLGEIVAYIVPSLHKGVAFGQIVVLFFEISSALFVSSTSFARRLLAKFDIFRILILY